ncbi:MAG: hypothetical protein LBK06_05285 [Planctomycetaceae bacterium]|nr:hypothetical protein [Planctomycetaceae bacterium]
MKRLLGGEAYCLTGYGINLYPTEAQRTQRFKLRKITANYFCNRSRKINAYCRNAMHCVSTTDLKYNFP